MDKKEFLKEKETRRNENERIEDIRRLNIVRNNIVKGNMKYNFEYSKEFYLIEPHINDLYIQN